MEDVGWRMEDGELTIKNLQLTMVNGQWTLVISY